MRTHLAGPVTTLATAWRIERTDGVVFRFATSSDDALLDFGLGDGLQTFTAAGEGYNRSNIENDSELNVGNMEVVGIFNELDETELRRGLFDGAEVHIAFFNYEDTSDGLIKMVRGEFSEVIVTPNGFFNVELRDITQRFSREFGEHYSKDCREDLGGPRCRVPLLPPVLLRNQAVVVGEFYRVSDVVDAFSDPVLITHYDNDFNDDSTLAAVGTVGSNTALTTAHKAFGPRGLELSPTGSTDQVGVEYADRDEYTMGSGEFTIEAHVRFKSDTTIPQVIMSKHDPSPNRGWFFQANLTLGTLAWFASTDGGASFIGAAESFAFAVDTDYHVAVTRDGSDDLRLFVDGTQIGSTTTHAGTPFENGQDLRVGRYEDTAPSGTFRPFDGFIDEARLVIGTALYTSNFTPPASPFQNFAELLATGDATDFNDRIYEVTTAGTTAVSQPTYDTTVNNTTADGTAVLTARFSWFRAATVDTVLDPRREFRVTELTPNTGQAVSDRVLTAVGFPDDWFNGGIAQFDTGNNAGRRFEVKDFVADDGVTIEQDVLLWGDLPFDIQVGDVVLLLPGCDKTFATCQAKFDNALNFVGEPFVPSPDVFGQYPDARS